MEVTAIIPAITYIRDDGRKASLYGPVPWLSDAEASRWTLRALGWTWEITDSRGGVTVGAGRPPATTRGDAVEIANQLNEIGRPGKRRFTLDDVPDLPDDRPCG